MLNSKQPQERIYTELEIHEMISSRLRGQRPVAWEEDISRNTLDTEPFENLIPPTEMETAAFEFPRRMRFIEPYMGERKLEDLIARDHYPIPCAKDREGYSPGADGLYWLSGLEDYLKIMDVANRHNFSPKSIFDFGCASGRVIRHFAVQSEIQDIWGSDINARHIRWLCEHMPDTVKPIANHCIPSLPIRDSSIDLVTAFSVFTHIDTFETCWLAELSRILTDDGMAYLTVHNENTWEVIRGEIDNQENRLVQDIVKIDPTVKEKLLVQMPDTRTVYRHTQSGPYRAQVFHSNNYLEQVWGRFFKIEEILPCHHVRQTVVVLRKK